MLIEVRPALSADHDSHLELRRLMLEELTEARGGAQLIASLGDSSTATGLEGTPEGGRPGAVRTPTRLLGFIGEVPVGFAEVAQSPEVPEIAEISELFVHPDCRGVGVGAALLQRCLEWAAARGYQGIDSRVLPGARDAKNFFEAAGMVARLITVHRRFV